MGARSEVEAKRVARSWDAEYLRGRYGGERPLPFVDEIIRTLEDVSASQAGLGLYVVCGNGRNYLPLVTSGLRIVGLDLSAEALKQLLNSEVGGPRRLACVDFRRGGIRGAFEFVISIQCFQHGGSSDAAVYFDRVKELLRPGGLFFLRVNSVATEIDLAHSVLERGARGGLTIRYDAGLIGNWEGESGKLPADSAARVADARRRFTPNPNDHTYPQGGSSNEDYFAFEWGPVLFVILNVQSYTVPSGERHNRGADVTVVEDWTLGSAQFGWMEQTLSSSDHPFKFVCIHHAVGGNGATENATLYGRGGPRAAGVGEQKLVHEAMREFGVQTFFYGHDHVFVDEMIDDIHYTLPGSCGAPWKFGREITGYGRYWGDSGHARLTVRPDQATVSFVNQAGQILHEFAVEPR